eukprot:CAMPEP_0117499194 /NCGR_PEP_ID=MMETSP0784-20121206/22115_1 /TAXON_ID=39447 /ORGANISM="" /LENGTH=425 /DNA_ID=CAMNT_0005294325 /DNA_START=79 /DNA_END=1356 /DNA_ORIENTATION=+
MAAWVLAVALALAHLARASSIFTVLLDKQHVPVMMNGREVAKKTAYFGTVHVGFPSPQSFTAVFDTGSGHLFIPSVDCKEETCLAHKRYDMAASRSAVALHHDGTRANRVLKEDRDQVSISYGTGEIVGDFVRDIVCIGESAPTSLKKHPRTVPSCVRMRTISAREMTNEPFNLFQFDGVLGLGLPALALDPEFHFFGMLAKKRQIEPIFSFFLSKNDDVRSEIAFGGHDEKRMLGELRYVPVANPEQGYWRVRINSVRVGNQSVPECDNGACTAIVDTGTSLLGVPTETAKLLTELTARVVGEGPASDADDLVEAPEDGPDCTQEPGPPVIFDMGDFVVQLDAVDYSRPTASQVRLDGSNISHTVCRASLLPVDMPPLGKLVFIWGEPVLSKYYTSYDHARKRIGFAPAAHPEIAGIQTAPIEV